MNLSAIADRAESLATELEQAGPSVTPDGLSEVVALLRAASAALATAELTELSLAAQTEAMQSQAEMLRLIGVPVLEIEQDVLCVPAVGPLDHARVLALEHAVLEVVGRIKVRHVIVDLTGAVVAHAEIVKPLVAFSQVLTLLGITVAFSGIKKDLALYFMPFAEQFTTIATFGTLKSALRAQRNHDEGQTNRMR